MPGKSRRSKGKHPHHSKKSRARQRYGAIPVTPAAAETPRPAATITMPSALSQPTPTAKSRIAQYPYIITELKRIGILAGIILVILIILALVLS